MPRRKSLIGKTFGKLKVISDAASLFTNHGTYARYVCICDCGKTHTALAKTLLNGGTKSCGCILTKHGMYKNGTTDRTFRCWNNMIRRCTDLECDHYKYYGGRGIIVCDRWLYSFPRFLDDMGACPAGYSIERIDNNGNYEPQNCKWIPFRHQQKNKRRNVILTYLGVTGCLWDMCIHFGINYSAARARNQRGLSVEEIFSKTKLIRRAGC